MQLIQSTLLIQRSKFIFSNPRSRKMKSIIKIILVNCAMAVIVSSAKLPDFKKIQIPKFRSYEADFNSLKEIFCGAEKLESEAKEIQTMYHKLLDLGLHVPIDSILGKPIVGAEAWVRSAIPGMNFTETDLIADESNSTTC